MPESADRNVENFFKNIFKDKKEKKADFVVAIVVNIIIWYIANNILNWNISFITPEFSQVLGILNVLILSTIGANIIFLAYYRGWLHNLLKIILNVLGLLVASAFYQVFPFSFSQEIYTWGVLLALILAMVVYILMIFIEIIKFILNQVFKRDYQCI
ncbi:MAG: hypothetical protein CIT03_03830 [Methanobacterium sp.]|nr:MAG: hypothetical protein CIT03_03830 [Methanobacterium sp.]